MIDIQGIAAKHANRVLVNDNAILEGLEQVVMESLAKTITGNTKEAIGMVYGALLILVRCGVFTVDSAQEFIKDIQGELNGETFNTNESD